MKKIAILTTQQCWAMSLFSVTDFFRIARTLESHLGFPADLQVHLVSLDGKPTWCADGQPVRVSGALCELPPQDLVIFPAVEGSSLDAVATWDDTSLQWLRRHIESQGKLLTLSTGAAQLAASGLINGHQMNTHWAFLPKLNKQYPAIQFITRESYCMDGNLYSTGSMLGVFDALLDWLAEQKGDHFAQLCATHLLLSSPTRLRPMIPGVRNHDDGTVQAVQDWLESNYEHTLPLAQLALRFGFSERNLKRRFHQATGIAPNQYLQKVRVDKAKKWLIASSQSVQAIAHHVGYENVSHFIRLFKRETQQTPAQWRNNSTQTI
ncbi:MAG: GlxA family transcriptional regulator [Alcanivorax sediminis]|uniref:GlxA family transcriptional regulator n=1 Tax=Alcanivorax sediminis TaxID=2663008 RepID=UPI003C435FF5